MMTRSPLKLLFFLIMAVSILLFLNRQFFNNVISFGLVPRYSQESAAYAFTKLSIFKNIIDSIRITSVLIRKNEELEKRNNELLSFLSEMEVIKKDNEFLRKTLNISDKLKPKLETGNIYTWSLNPGGYSVLLNKGKRDSISPGNIIITDERILIGIVEKVENNFSRILAITDPKFKITVKILGSNIFGIANGVFNNSLNLNLISQDDAINEGDVVVSSGSDVFPDSLILGRISKIYSTEDQLFKKVSIEPAMKNIILGPVIIIK